MLGWFVAVYLEKKRDVAAVFLIGAAVTFEPNIFLCRNEVTLVARGGNTFPQAMTRPVGRIKRFSARLCPRAMTRPTGRIRRFSERLVRGP